MLIRCPWAKNALDIQYHDEEWGKPVYDDQTLFEFIILEGMQAGLSWSTILKKREAYRECFYHFDAEKMARFRQKEIEKLLLNDRIIRNRLKIAACVKNAKAYLALKEKNDTFADFLWQFVDGQPKINHWKTQKAVPVTTKTSDALSKALKQSGFSFVGSTICYAFMQAVGMVNDHLVSCFCHPVAKKQ